MLNNSLLVKQTQKFIFSDVYDVCAFHKNLTEQLYDQVVEFFHQYSEQILDQLNKPSEEEGLLTRYSDLWTNYRTSAKLVDEIFKYMQQVWIPTQPGKHDIYSVSNNRKITNINS